MNKARKRFVLYAMLAVFALLGILLGIINGVNFTMASQDADEITRMLSENQGAFPGMRPMDDMNPRMNMRNGRPAQMGPLGPDSPEMIASMRYFTFAFDDEGNAERVAFFVSAVSEEDAAAWARSLVNEHETGWTGATYRYRVYEANGKTYVTVIDQGRELLPSYRILIISVIGLAVGLIVSYLVLMDIGRRLFKPLEEADRKQKRFIADVEKEFKVPLTIINANTEIMEREGGETDQTRSINRQVKRMTALVKDLASVAVFDEENLTKAPLDLSALAMAAADAARGQFEDKGRALRLNAAAPAMVSGDSEAMSDMLVELIDNALKFSLSWAELTVRQTEGRVTVTASNDTTLQAGSVDQVFDRFTRLENAQDVPGTGLGLAHVKDIVKAHNGRASARVADGVFTLRIDL
ncbi:MAG: HAMP domain-containing histidine kinase [Clostridia bacterium]|nr:HAMP domain-containing histidine kinase [Clostridia bacterium]